MLLAGDQVFKYSDPNFDSVDEGYPRKIREVALEEGFASIDPMFTYDLDAVLRAGTTGTIYLFKGQQYAGSDDPTTRKQINADWGKVRNNFVPVGTATNMSVDAAFVSPNGMTYLFKGDQFIRYSNFAQVFVDEGFPLPIRDNWGNLPAPYEAGIDGGFVFEGKTYLLRDGVIPGDGEYVRFSRPDYRKIDTIYPQKIADRAARWGDYLLGDIKLLSFFKQKVDETSSGSNSFTDFLNQRTVDQEDPYATLNAMFGWDISEVKWIQRNNAFLSVIDPEETRFDLEIIERMTQIFGTTQKLGADPSKVYAEVWHNWFDSSSPTDVKTAADNLYRYLANKTSATDWATLQQQIHDELNLIQRDIFIPLSIALDSSLTRPKDLYDLLLIDVLMGSQARTSKVKEAISALQLYFHRYFVNLEQPPGSSPAQDPQTRELLKERWKWLKNYQMWEANRMVFLYPENYIRPELRSTKTPQFKDLESALLQGELNLDTAEAAFTSYLEDFGIVSNLKIAGANVYEVGDFQNGGEKVLVLFGHTRMEPRQYYYRTASYSKQAEPNTDDLVVWSPWEKVDQTIDSDRVFPIMVNGRLMVFWIEIKDIEEPEAKFKSKQATETTSQETISQVNVAQKQLLHQAEIKYSLRKHDAQWTPPQQIKKGIDLVYKIDAAYCEGDNDSVIVTFCGEYCQKTRQDTQEVEAKRIEEFDEFKNLPESFKSGIDAATIFKGKRYLFKGGQCVIQDVVQETTGQALQSLSIRDLIVMPNVKDPSATLLTVSPGTYGTDQYITDQSGDNLQKAEVLLSEGVSAAFGLTADILTLVDTQGHYSFYQEQDGKLYPMSSILILSLLVTELGPGVTTLSFPQMISTLTMRDGQFRRPDAVFKQGQTFYVIRDGQYECYNQVGDDLVPLDGFPKPLRGNLNFNMDNFFNHLHLENSHDLVFLSYTSPKDQLLLYGKLKADFTFQEIPIQSDRALLMVLGWNTLLQNNVRDYSPYRSVAIASSVSEFITNFTAQRANIAPVLAVEAAIAQLNQALDSARQILPQETKATTNDGHPWHTLRRADGSWTGLGDVQSEIAIPGPVTAVAAAGDGTAGETQYMFATADGHLWHTIRHADGSWQPLGDVQGQFAIPGPVTVVAAAGDGIAGETQYMFATADGHLWHTLRRADGSWTGLEDVQGKITIPGPVTAVAAAGDGTAGETQYMFATADGHLWHTLRHADGSWQPLGDVQSQFTIPGPVTVVAATGDGIAGETQYMFATADGHLWHTLRRADGSWTGLEDVQGKITIPGPVTAVAAAGDGTAGETQYMFATADGHLWHTLRRADGSWQGLGDVQGQFAIPAPVRAVAAAGDGITGETQYFFATADGQDVPAVDQLQIKILSNLQAISNVLAPFQNQGTLLTEINTLLGFVPTLGPAIDQVKAAKARAKTENSGCFNRGHQYRTADRYSNK